MLSQPRPPVKRSAFADGFYQAMAPADASRVGPPPNSQGVPMGGMMGAVLDHTVNPMMEHPLSTALTTLLMQAGGGMLSSAVGAGDAAVANQAVQGARTFAKGVQSTLPPEPQPFHALTDYLLDGGKFEDAAKALKNAHDVTHAVPEDVRILNLRRAFPDMMAPSKPFDMDRAVSTLMHARQASGF